VLAAELAALLVVIAGIAVLGTNLRRLVPMEAYPHPADLPRVSVLVPARDEERDIEACVRSLLSQDYPDFEVLVLDDGSTDATPAILRRISAEDPRPRLRLLAGRPLPDGWLGKPWACAQLAAAASGDLLLFTDADTFHTPRALRAGVATALAERSDLLTALPHIDSLSWSERLIMPAISWSTVTLLPLLIAYRTSWPWLSASNGQYLLFRRDAYEALGGHASVRGEIVEDMALGQRVRAAGLCWRLGDASDLVSTRMYRSLGETFSGLGKNMFGIFGYGLLRYVLMWPIAAVVCLLPTAVLIAAALGRPLPGASVPLAALVWVLTAVQFWAGYRRFGYAPALALFFPLTMALLIMISVWSLVLSVLGRASWKGRVLGRTPLRWV
jgi:chlorobactene glucosyltransferase